jgi:EmrB/QacA subfamily drug resistance transporter
MNSKQRKLEQSALVVAAVTNFMAPFMISAVNVALPAMQKEYAIGAVALGWIATSYLLATAVFLVPLGRLADIYGHKKYFLWGLVIFTLSCLATVWAGSLTAILVLRVIQGIGSAAVVTSSMAILTAVFPPQRRGKAIGIYVSAVYIGLSLGPFVGGILTQHLGWRSIFILATPIGLGSIWVTVAGLKGEWADARGEAFDISGSLLYAIAIVLIIYGSTLLPHISAIVLMVIGCISLVGFIIWELKCKTPVFEVRLFSGNKLFAFSNLAALVHYGGTFAVTFLLSLYLQYVRGLSPQMAGLMLVVQPVCMAVFSPLTGKLSDKIEPSRLASIGMAITALGLLFLSFINAQTPFYQIIVLFVIMGIGFALFSSPNMNAIMSSVSKKYYGIASGAVSTMRLIGQMASMAIATVVFAILMGQAKIGPHNYDQLGQSMQICLLISTGLCICGIFFSLFRGNLRE